MTRTVYLFICAILCILNAVNGADNKENMRLLEFNETTRIWVTEKQAEQLGLAAEPGKGFMDITDLQGTIKNSRVPLVIPVYPSVPAIVNPLLALINSANIRNTIQQLSSYTTRYYTSPTGRESSNWLLQQYALYKGSRTDIQVNAFPHSWIQSSIVAKIMGTAPASEGVVIIGGHIDSTSSGTIAPGADDDASGSAGVLEIFRVMATSGYKPYRTVEFHGYSAEEVGLRGSLAIATDYNNRGVEVLGMMQLDMIGYIRPGTTATIGLVTDFTNALLNAFIRNLILDYTEYSSTNTACGYACSDHGSWNRLQYAASMPFEGIFSNSNPNIHTVRDTLSLLNMDHAREFAKLGCSFVVELSEWNRP